MLKDRKQLKIVAIGLWFYLFLQSVEDWLSKTISLKEDVDMGETIRWTVASAIQIFSLNFGRHIQSFLCNFHIGFYTGNKE